MSQRGSSFIVLQNKENPKSKRTENTFREAVTARQRKRFYKPKVLSNDILAFGLVEARSLQN